MDFRCNAQKHEGETKKHVLTIKRLYRVFNDVVEREDLPEPLKSLLLNNKYLIFSFVHQIIERVKKGKWRFDRGFLGGIMYIFLKFEENFYLSKNVNKVFLSKYLGIKLSSLDWYVKKLEKELGIIKLCAADQIIYLNPDGFFLNFVKSAVRRSVRKHMVMSIIEDIKNRESFVTMQSLSEVNFQSISMLPRKFRGQLKPLILKMIKQEVDKYRSTL